MATLIVEHEVEDYPTWRKAYDAHGGVRHEYNLTKDRVYCDPTNNNFVCVIAHGSTEDLTNFTQSPQLAAAMKEAGVIGKPRILISEQAATHTV